MTNEKLEKSIIFWVGSGYQYFMNPFEYDKGLPDKSTTKIKPFGHSRAPKKIKKMPHFDHFPRPGKLTHMR